MVIVSKIVSLTRVNFFKEQTKADHDLFVNLILFEAALAYFDWLQAYKDSQIFNRFLTNPQVRFEGVNTVRLIFFVFKLKLIK
jgi:hypothetical protein